VINRLDWFESTSSQGKRGKPLQRFDLELVEKLAANTTFAENLVTENLVDLIGVAGSADGQILALQYDIGLN